MAVSEIAELQATVADLKSSLEALSAVVERVHTLSQETRSLVGPFGVTMPGGAMLVQTIHGVKFLIDPNDRVMAPQLIVYRQWEPELSRLFLRNLTPSSVMVDVGANFGYFTCLAANRIGQGGGQVYAFEPNPRLVPLLRDNCRINWSMAPIHINEAAVGAVEGWATISVPLDGAANATLTKIGGEYDRHDVRVISLDSVIPGPVDWMKIDVEGHEMGVLQGAREVISRSPDIKIVMEWSAHQMIGAGTRLADIIALIEELGLAAYTVPASGDLVESVPISFTDLAAIQYDNIILARP